MDREGTIFQEMKCLVLNVSLATALMVEGQVVMSRATKLMENLRTRRAHLVEKFQLHNTIGRGAF